GRRLPRTYCEFLAQHDGWPRFYEGASLLGTANLGRRDYEAMVQAVFQAAETPVPVVGPPISSRMRKRAMIPFGADLQGTTVFAFDASRPKNGAELPVIAWVGELGLSFSGFEEFLDSVLEWLTFDTALEEPQLRASA